MDILIVGYGNIGKHIYDEFKTLKPDIYDPHIPPYSFRQDKHYDIAFICVPTDSLPGGSCDTSIVEKAVMDTDAEIIVIKSTIPPGTTCRLIALTGKKVIFSPEHYGVTQHCKTDPGFVVLGGEKSLCVVIAQAYYKVKNGYYKILFTDSVTAELSKYMLNSFLALKVTFCNEFAALAERFGVSYPELRELFIADERIGPSHTFCYPDKPYYDSHCFNKDVPALVSFAGDDAPLLARMNEINLAKKATKDRSHTPEHPAAPDVALQSQQSQAIDASAAPESLRTEQFLPQAVEYDADGRSQSSEGSKRRRTLKAS
ncbi:MAG: hypothetical protein FWD58_07165 [Firmicutes bacterium]|nr:hypothetical protein [Bacillota bacterium]